MLQMRPRDGDKRWFDADRDLVYAMPRYMARVLFDFENKEETREFASKLAKLFVVCKERSVSVEELKKMIEMLRNDYSEYMVKVERDLFSVIMGDFWGWCGNVAPRAPSDVALDLYELDQLSQKMIGGEPRV